MTYLVLDTNILVSALWRNLHGGKPAHLLRLCVAGHYETVCTQAILAEYLDVLTRPKFGFHAEDVAGIVDFFRFRSLSADPLFPSLSRPQCSHAADQKFYDAVCCWDALLITGNKKDFPVDERVLTIAEFMEHRKMPEPATMGALQL